MTIRELVKSISKKEWQFVIFLCAVMILLTGLPYAYGYLNAPPGYFYNGIHSMTPGDSTVYFSYINQIKAGHFLLQDNFTSEPQTGGLLNLFWLAIGLFAWIFNLPADLAFHLSRLILIPVFLGLSYLFFTYIFTEVGKRKLALIFICFASGIGAYFASIIDKLYPLDYDAPVYLWPVDIWVPEANIFSILYQTPHFIASLSCCVLVFLLMLLAWENNKYWYSFLAGLVGCFWFNFHPFYFPYLVFILFGFLAYKLISHKKLNLIWHYLIVVILSSPFVFYHYYKIKTDFVIGGRAGQNVLNTPPFLFVFLGFGFLLLGAIGGLVYLAKTKQLLKKDKYVFCLIWLLLGFGLLYSPIFFQIRFLQGLEIPLVIFTVIFLNDYLLAKPRLLFIKNNAVLAAFIFIFLFSFSIIFNLTRDIVYFQEHLSRFYLLSEFKDAANWLKNNNPDNKIILSYEYTGQLIPALANQRVYLAHHIETIDYKGKRKEVDDLLAGNLDDDQAKAFFKAKNIGYLFFSELENKFARYKPADKDYLNQVFKQGQAAIYKFIE